MIEFIRVRAKQCSHRMTAHLRFQFPACQMRLRIDVIGSVNDHYLIDNKFLIEKNNNLLMKAAVADEHSASVIVCEFDEVCSSACVHVFQF